MQILAENAKDVAAASAEGSGVGIALLQRLQLTTAKLEVLACGVEQVAR